MRTIIVGSRIGKFFFPKKIENQFPSGSVLNTPILTVDSNTPRNHKAESIKRYMILGFGQRDKLGRVDRLNPLVPSKTIIAGGTGGGGRSHLHPFIPRTMTVRECARLQTFPDDYIFTGPVARQFTQVGNAVPPVLGYKMACAIYESIYAERLLKEVS
ncbi:MAG: DNA cytosine methyltransferase [Treponema sp.]|nr:DNA cytosine methyltransferase [Treponema sp.]